MRHGGRFILKSRRDAMKEDPDGISLHQLVMDSPQNVAPKSRDAMR